MTYDLIQHIERQIKFSSQTFGPGRRTNGVTAHIQEELEEIRENPTDLEEWIDVILLGLDGAWRSGHTAQEIALALDKKLTKNEQRDWPDWTQASQDEPINHSK